MKSNKISIVDYGMGNIYSVFQACKTLGYDPILIKTPEEIKDSNALILPGVGAFKQAMEILNSTGMSDAIIDHVSKERPLMGICLGFQLMFTSSEEFGFQKGLNLLDGNIKKFPKFNKKQELIRIPYIGWNKVKCQREDDWVNTPFRDFKSEQDYVYLVHSYYLDAMNQECIGTSNYLDVEYCSSVLKDNVFGVQFHPEKSGKAGLNIIKNFTLSI